MGTQKNHQGVVKFFNESKGYGFITEGKTGKEYFVHVSNLNDGRIEKDNRVSFELETGNKGPKAVNVTII